MIIDCRCECVSKVTGIGRPISQQATSCSGLIHRLITDDANQLLPRSGSAINSLYSLPRHVFICSLHNITGRAYELGLSQPDTNWSIAEADHRSIHYSSLDDVS